MKISAKLVMELRAKTNAGMMDCKKALLECEGNLEEAIRYLREKGITKAAKKADRVASEGLVFTATSEDMKKGAMLEFNSETDFVAKNEEFVSFGEQITQIILHNDIKDLEELLKYEIDGTTLKEKETSLIAKIGENMHIRRFSKVETDGFVTSYRHMGGKIGVLVVLSGEKNEENIEKAKDISMHVAAMAPEYLTESEVPIEVLDKEKEIIKAQLLEQGKPEKIIEKIMIGKVSKYYEENCLLHQKFVKDDKLTVQQYAGSLKVDSFYRYKLGEGIEKKDNDFAAEVEAQMKR